MERVSSNDIHSLLWSSAEHCVAASFKFISGVLRLSTNPPEVSDEQHLLLLHCGTILQFGILNIKLCDVQRAHSHV
jgi:hypothetical protein